MSDFFERNVMKLFSGNSLWFLISNSDAVTKLILVGLLVTSIICWTIVFYKITSLRTKMAASKNILERLKKINSWREVYELAHAHKDTYSGHLLFQQTTAVKNIQLSHKTTPSERRYALLDDMRFSLIDDALHEEQEHLSVLLVTAGVAPLIGLFGTVWGLTHSFLSISEKQGADIVTVAPGIAEALITTLAGLMVAIPAFMFYHYLQNNIDRLGYQLTKITEYVHFLMQEDAQ